MKDCTTCKYGFVDEQLGFPMCHHPKRFFEDCVDFNMHEEIEEPKKATGTEEKKLPDGLEEAAKSYATEDAGWFPDGRERTQIVQEEFNAFKAGAEWMAQQGVTAEGEIVKDISNKLAVTAKTPLLENRFNFGEKVLIQIRKK